VFGFPLPVWSVKHSFEMTESPGELGQAKDTGLERMAFQLKHVCLKAVREENTYSSEVHHTLQLSPISHVKHRWRSQKQLWRSTSHKGKRHCPRTDYNFQQQQQRTTTTNKNHEAYRQIFVLGPGFEGKDTM
jgi:hypothetical protein